MSYQKTYHGQSANQILAGANIDVMAADNVEITHPEWPGCIFVQDQDGDLIITNDNGIVVRLLCGIKATDKLQALVDAAERKQIAILKSADKKNGTTYADNL